MLPLTRAEVHRTAQEVMDQRGAADRGMLDEIWRRLLRRLAEGVRLGEYESVCRPLIDEIIAAWCEIVSYLHMPSETVHPFVKPEGEKLARGYLVRMLVTIKNLRVYAHEYPGTGAHQRRELVQRVLDQQEITYGDDLKQLDDFMRQTHDPRKRIAGASFNLLKVRTGEFERLVKTYLTFLDMTMGTEAYNFFREQYMMAEHELNATSILCNANPKEMVH